MNKEYDYCLRCGRKLKSVANRERGYGLVCWEKSHKELNKCPLFDVTKKNIEKR